MAWLFQAALLDVSMVKMWQQLAEGKKFFIYREINKKKSQEK